MQFALVFFKTDITRITALFAHLPDPALLDVELERELHEHGTQGVGVSHLGHRDAGSKTSLKIRHLVKLTPRHSSENAAQKTI